MSIPKSLIVKKGAKELTVTLQGEDFKVFLVNPSYGDLVKLQEQGADNNVARTVAAYIRFEKNKPLKYKEVLAMEPVALLDLFNAINAEVGSQENVKKK